jgi:hypothetical protein
MDELILTVIPARGGSKEWSVSIDSERDFLLAELVMREKLGITA